MDNNPITPPVNPLPVNNPVVMSQPNNSMPQIPQAKSNLGRNLVTIISAVLIVVVIAATGYLLILGNAKKTANIKVQGYMQPTIVISPTTAPTPSIYQVNPKDTSDSAINSDTTAVNQNLNSLDTDLNNVDQSFNDQQTNLQ
jgi:hypothetical protein